MTLDRVWMPNSARTALITSHIAWWSSSWLSVMMMENGAWLRAVVKSVVRRSVTRRCPRARLSPATSPFPTARCSALWDVEGRRASAIRPSPIHAIRSDPSSIFLRPVRRSSTRDRLVDERVSRPDSYARPTRPIGCVGRHADIWREVYSVIWQQHPPNRDGTSTCHPTTAIAVTSTVRPSAELCGASYCNF